MHADIELIALPVAVARRDERFFIVRGKGGKERMVPLSGKAREALKVWLDERGKEPATSESPWLFPAASEGGFLPRQVFARDLKGLAARAGIPMTPTAPVKAGSVDDKQTLFDAMNWIQNQYHACLLKSEQGREAREYLAQRNVSASSIDKFRIGFAPDDWTWPGRAHLRRRAS